MQKRTEYWQILAITAGLLASNALLARAEDLSQPCWRNQPASTFQNWMFSSSANPTAPEAQFNTGNPQATINLGALASGWIPNASPLGTRTGLWDLGSSGSMVLGLPESAGSVNGYRYVVVQVTEYQDPGTYAQLAQVSVPGATAVSQAVTPVETNIFGDQWVVERTVWKLPSCPANETVALNASLSGALIDQVVVDTLSIDYPCPGDLNEVADLGQCGKANVGWVLPSVDGCVITNVLNTIDSVPVANPHAFPVGDTVVVSTVTDGLGAQKVCSFNVHISDDQLPVVTCPPDLVVFKEPNQCGAQVSFSVTATDNCTVTNITSTPASGSVFPLGLTTVTSTARDASGNVSLPCTFTVRVIDLSGDVAAVPCWRGQTGSTYQHWAFSTPANPASPEVKTNANGTAQASVSVGMFGSGWLEEVGLLGCRQGLWDLGSSGSMVLGLPESAGSVNGYRYVVVQVTEYQDPGTYAQLAQVSVPGATAVSQAVTPVETNIFGDQWVVERTVWKLPSCPANETVALNASLSGALIDQVVVDTLSIDYPCPGDLNEVADLGQCGKANVGWVLPSVDGCVITNVLNTIDSVPVANPHAFPVGDTVVVSTVTDGLGAQKVCSFNVHISDDQLPVVTCPPDLVVFKEPNQCGAQVSFSVTATDNCTVTNITSTPASGSVFPLGLTTVTSTARDASGNVSLPCTFTVRVIDLSGDVAAVPCWRGQTGSTYQHWAFSTPANPASPEVRTNANGTAQASVSVGMFGSGWLEEVGLLGCRQGLWDLGSSGSMVLGLPESAGSVNGYRYVVVQVTEYQDPGTYAQLAQVSVPGATAVSQAVTPVETNIFGDQWVVERTVWKLPSCPANETVALNASLSGALIDQVVVDTLSIDYPCPGDLNEVADLGQCGKANVGWVLPSVDGCVITNVLNTIDSVPVANPHAFPVGDTVVVSTVTDGLGAQKVCSFNVHISDDQLPVVTCPPDLVVFKEPNQCGAQVSFSVTATDNCTVTNITSTPASGSVFPLGLTTVTSTARDASGNVSLPCTFTVRVIDLSGDVAAVPCWRGQTGSTYQHWAFSTPANPASPEVKTNANGTAQASVSVGMFGSGWLEEVGLLGCRQGLWDLGSSGSMVLGLPESAGSVNGYRYVVVQVTEYQDPGTYAQLAQVSVPGATAVSQAVTPVETNIFGDQWVVERTVWKLPSCPANETVALNASLSGALIDQVVVDTLSIDYPCPGDLNEVADLGQCGKANVTWGLSALDNCKVTNMVCTPPIGSSFPVGITPVNCLIADAFGQQRNCAFNVTILDAQPPVIGSITATEAQPISGTVDVKACANPTLQGTVNFSISAGDNCGLTGGRPSLGLTNGAFGIVPTFISESPVGTFNFSWIVTSGTAPGTWVATVTALDSMNITTSTFNLCVDPSGITGQVQLQSFVGAARSITFVATGGTSSRTWTMPLSFSGGTANFNLLGIPAGTSGLSAKSSWNLRRKLAITLDVNGQGVAAFTGGSQLLGGDLDGDNRVDNSDYLILNSHFQTTDPTADINGSGAVTTSDFLILTGNWQLDGDPQ